jgi:hypothetical protein
MLALRRPATFGRCGGRSPCSLREFHLRSHEPDNMITFVSSPPVAAIWICGDGAMQADCNQRVMTAQKLGRRRI